MSGNGDPHIDPGPGSLACPACAEPRAIADRFCEACGEDLPFTAKPVTPPYGTPAITCPACEGPGGPASPDSYCGVCGRRWSPVRDHDELVDGPVVGLTDRGTLHWRNEDAVGVAEVRGDHGGFVLVVCDGVSVSQNPHLVSQAAVDGALPVLCAAVASGSDLREAMFEAAAAAQDAAAAVPLDPGLHLGPGACTFVAAAVRDGAATFGSIGDSRAYWIDANGAMQIGRDDSVAAELIASGRLTAAQALASPDAHAITKWLGADTLDACPTVTRFELSGPGLVLLASDGLWNYAPESRGLARLIGPLGAETPLELARRLAAFAEGAGGADNITVAIGPHGLGELADPVLPIEEGEGVGL